ncbi:TetR/AcrR family transcriptional regulator [Williamsia deligens]|uniref:TetR/AcrR family transcriptional regulator n=1 Tax=Williamsia deligens TaxID=321325 RepID=A0ABW3G4R4_9NOCA|nr:TetR/AcrR family transcriptional regulator [Williamsia deligens]MCP2194028.1 transcriptional regulator, TetR family [Williamsia deligens]
MTAAPARSRRHPDRRRALLDAAATLFAERGYARVSVADVARAAGVTGPGVYRHFADKQTLLAETVMARIDDLQACTDGALTDHTPDDPALRRDALIDAACRMGLHRPDAAILWRWNASFLSEEQNIQVRRRTGAILDRWADALTGDRDLDPRSSRLIAWAVLSIVGSTSAHSTRIPVGRAHARLVELVGRTVAASPDSAPALVRVDLPDAPAESRRDQILDAASALFEKRGFGDTGVDDIGEAVGITGPSVYKHFPSKVAILTDIGRRSAARLEAGAMAARAATTGPAEFLGALVESYVTVLSRTPDLSVAFNNGPALRETDAHDLLAAQHHYVRRWIALVTEVEPGLPVAEAAVTVHAALSIANDAVRMRRGRMRPELPAQLACLMRGVLGL